ncbi:hypothetical protein ACVWZR_007122 [Bradyrhizobium sp. i1.3.1]
MAGVSAVSGVRMSRSRRDRHVVAVDQEAGALVGVGDHRIADDDAFVRFELNLESHACSPSTLLQRSVAAFVR